MDKQSTTVTVAPVSEAAGVSPRVVDGTAVPIPGMVAQPMQMQPQMHNVQMQPQMQNMHIQPQMQPQMHNMHMQMQPQMQPQMQNMQMQPQMLPHNVQMQPQMLPQNMQMQPQMLPHNVQMQPQMLPQNMQMQPQMLPQNMQMQPQMQNMHMPPQMQPQNQWMAPPSAQMGVADGPATITVKHAEPDSLQCCDAVCCCGSLGLQPDKRGGITVLIDGEDKSTLQQGQSGSWQVPPGQHQVEAKHGGVGGFFAGVFGSREVGSYAVTLGAGQTASFKIDWISPGCGSSKYNARFTQL